jgi:hypothetical protein
LTSTNTSMSTSPPVASPVPSSIDGPVAAGSFEAADDYVQRKAAKKKREAAASSVEPPPKRQRPTPDMPKATKDTKHADRAAGADVVGIHNSTVTFDVVRERLRWMQSLTGKDGDFLRKILRKNADVKLIIGPRSVKNHRDSTQKLDQATLNAIKHYTYLPPYTFGRRNNLFACGLSMYELATIPRKPKFAKGETMIVVGTGKGKWKLAPTAAPAPAAPTASAASA